MSFFVPRATFYGSEALSNDQLFKMAPSIFAQTAHESRSDKFRPIPTIDVIEGLRKEGFLPVAAIQGKTRIVGKEKFTKHMIRLRKDGDSKNFQVGDNVCEITLKNANDGTAAYMLQSGIFRIRCKNSMVTTITEAAKGRVGHTGKDVLQKVIDTTYTVLGDSHKALDYVERFGNIRLHREEQLLLAAQAHQLRFDTTEDEEASESQPALADAIRPERLLEARRMEDNGSDLWTTTQVIQENVIRGGLSAWVRSDTTRTGKRRATMRAVNGIDQDLKLNRMLWSLAEGYANLKAEGKVAA